MKNNRFDSLAFLAENTFSFRDRGELKLIGSTIQRSSKSFCRWALIAKLIERKQHLSIYLFFVTSFKSSIFYPEKLKQIFIARKQRFQGCWIIGRISARHVLKQHLSLLAELLVVEREATKLILIDAANDVVGNGRQHRFLACKFRVEIDGVFCASLK